MPETEAYQILSANLIYFLFRAGYIEEDHPSIAFAKGLKPDNSEPPVTTMNAASISLWGVPLFHETIGERQ